MSTEIRTPVTRDLHIRPAKTDTAIPATANLLAVVTHSPEAKADLQQIALYIATESKSLRIAGRFLDKLAKQASLYASHPEMGKRRLELGPNIFFFPVASFLVFYRPGASGIEIIRVIRGSRDLTQQF